MIRVLGVSGFPEAVLYVFRPFVMAVFGGDRVARLASIETLYGSVCLGGVDRD